MSTTETAEVSSWRGGLKQKCLWDLGTESLPGSLAPSQWESHSRRTDMG